MAVSLLVCNLALGEIRAPSIAAIDEESTEAAQCALYYPQCLRLLLERFEWSFATMIAPLARLADNLRSTEWQSAFALPADMATAKRLVCGGSYIIEAGVLYANAETGVLEYSLADVPESIMPALFKDALAYSLAARLAIPLRDSRETKGELLKQAEIATQRAIADDKNRQPDRELYDEVIDAREGYGNGWRWDDCRARGRI